MFGVDEMRASRPPGDFTGGLAEAELVSVMHFVGLHSGGKGQSLADGGQSLRGHPYPECCHVAVQPGKHNGRTPRADSDLSLPLHDALQVVAETE